MLRTVNFLIIVLGSPFLSQTVLAETQLVSCEPVQKQIPLAESTLFQLDKQREQIQEKTRQVYQALFACHAHSGLPLDQVAGCVRLEKEAPQQLQALVDFEIMAHQASRKLETHSPSVRSACPASVLQGTS